jgi:hypothetical protein
VLNARAAEMDEAFSPSSTSAASTIETCHQWVWLSMSRMAVRLSEG